MTLAVAKSAWKALQDGNSTTAFDMLTLDISGNPCYFHVEAYQYFSELAINKVLLDIAKLPEGELRQAESLIQLLVISIHNAAALKRLLQANTVLRKIAMILNEAVRLHVTGVRSCSTLVERCLLILAVSSEFSKKGNTALWTYVFEGFDWDASAVPVNMMDNNKGWKPLMFDLLETLEFLHDYKIPCNGPGISGMVDRNADDAKKVMPKYDKPLIERLNEKIQQEIGLWAGLWWCSNPKCDADSENGKFSLCGGCKLTRYCNQKCQKSHWLKGHKRQCLIFKDAVCETTEIVAWQLKRTTPPGWNPQTAEVIRELFGLG